MSDATAMTVRCNVEDAGEYSDSIIRLLERVTALERIVGSHEVTIRSLEAIIQEQAQQNGR